VATAGRSACADIIELGNVQDDAQQPHIMEGSERAYRGPAPQNGGQHIQLLKIREAIT